MTTSSLWWKDKYFPPHVKGLGRLSAMSSLLALGREREAHRLGVCSGCDRRNVSVTALRAG